MTFPWAAAAGAGLGAIVGSFGATLLLRWPAGESVARGRSRCDGCAVPLRAHELVPVVSHLVQHGRCRRCGAAIDPTHLCIELACAAIGALAGLVAPFPAALAWALLGWLLLLLAAFDWRHFWLPDALTLPTAAAGLAFAREAALADRAMGLAAGYASLALIAAGYRRLRGREGLGQGDAKLLGAVGAWLGWQALPFVLSIASVLGLLLVAVSVACGGQVSRTTRLPLGTLLCLAVLPGWGALRLLLPG